MAMTRKGMRKQVIENLAKVAPPNEQFVACVHGVTGPSPLLMALLDELPLGPVLTQSMRRFYFMTLTGTTIVVNRAGRLANRPKEIVAAVPIDASPISRIKRRRIWSSFYFQFPGEPKPTRINVHRIWKKDLDLFIAVMPHAVVGAETTAAFAPMPHQIPGQNDAQVVPQTTQQSSE